MKQKRKGCVMHSEKPWWVQELDEEMKRVLTINDKPKGVENGQNKNKVQGD